MNNKLRFLDLFAGIGGFRSGMEKEGHKCVGYVEWDKHARKSYENMYDTKGEWTRNDITEITNDEWKELRGKVDVICGGFPCQAFSVAGKRGGFNDARGTMFFEIARATKQIKPRLLLLENVKGLLSHDKGKTLDTIIKTLNDIGYRVDFEVLNSKFFGVPQNRERIFIVGVREDLVDVEPWINTKGTTVVPKGKRRISEYERVKTFNFDWPKHEEVTTRLRDILEPEVDEKFYLSDDKTAKLVAQLEAKNEGERMSRQAVETFNESEQPKEHGDMIQAFNKQYLKGGICPTLTTRPEGFKTASLPVVEVEPHMLGHVDISGGHREPKLAEKQEWWGDYESEHIEWETELKIRAEEVRPVLTPERMEKRQNGRRFKDDGEPMFTLTAQDRHGIAVREATKKGYAIAEQGDSVNVTYPDSKTRRGRVGKGVAQTLQAGEVNQGTVTNDLRIRKLTPKECFRLQGFTDEQFHKAEEVNSNSQLYKQAGNSVTVNVIQAIAERL